MSRSYREPYAVDGYGCRWKKTVKRYANKVVRKIRDVPDGMAYKKLFESWDICDYRWRVEKPIPGGRNYGYMWGGRTPLIVTEDEMARDYRRVRVK